MCGRLQSQVSAKELEDHFPLHSHSLAQRFQRKGRKSAKQLIPRTAPFPGFTFEINGPIVTLLYDYDQYTQQPGEITASVGICELHLFLFDALLYIGSLQ